MLKRITLVALTFFLLKCDGPHSTSSTWYKVEDAYADGTSLRGMQVAPHATESNVSDLLATGVNLIRYQMTSEPIYDEQSYLAWVQSHITYVAYLKDNIIKDRAKVVLDLHTPPFGYSGTKAAMFTTHPHGKATFIKAWKMIATYFKGTGKIHAYDIGNELAGRLEEVSNLQYRAITEIRKIDTRTVCIITTPYGDPVKFKDLDKAPFSNIWYTFHFYNPLSFTHQGIYTYPSGKVYPDGGFNKNYLRGKLKHVVAFKAEHRARIYAGEFSVSNFSDIESHLRYLKDLLSLFEEYGINYTYHAWREADVWNPELNPEVLNLLKSYFKKNHPTLP